MSGVGRELEFRPLATDDLELLCRWLAAPHVALWWHSAADLDAVANKYGPRIAGDEPVEVFVTLDGDTPIGVIQRYRSSDFPEWERNAEWARAVDAGAVPRDSAGIDYLIGEVAYVGHGVGPEMIDRFIEGIWDTYDDVEAVVVPVDEENRRSWRALENAGFERVWSNVPHLEDPGVLEAIFRRWRPGRIPD